MAGLQIWVGEMIYFQIGPGMSPMGEPSRTLWIRIL
jgi:hypothetical protein